MLSKVKNAQPQQYSPLDIPFFDRFLGLNTVDPANLLLPNEAVAALNWKLNDAGKLETRCGLKRCTTTALSSGKYLKHLSYIPIDGTFYFFGVSDDYKLYKYSNDEPNMVPSSSLGTLSGNAVLLPFNGKAAIFDTSYLKYSDSTTIYSAYDAGTGSGGYLYDDYLDYITPDGSIDLWTAGTTIAIQFITTPNTGYAWPVTVIELWLKKTGSPTGAINAKVWTIAGAETLVDGIVSRAQFLTTNWVKYSFTFASGSTLTNNTQYRFGLEYSSGGDAANYVSVGYATVTSGGLVQTYNGSWSATATTQHLMIGVKPGLPPKASFGAVHQTRLFVMNPDYPGRAYYSNVRSLFDWSTPDGGGWVSALDDNAYSFKVGALLSQWGQLLAAGKAEQPYLARLIGSSPSSYKLESVNQAIGTTDKVFLSTGDDIWYAQKEGVNSLSGVQEYGDLRTFSRSDQVQNLIRTYFTTAAFAAYNPDDGQYVIKLAGYSNALVFHTKHPRKHPVTGRIVYPVTEFSFTGITPAWFGYLNGLFYVTATDGHFYRLDPTLVADNGAAITHTLESGFMEMPLGVNHIRDAYVRWGTSDTSMAAKLSVYKDGSGTATKDLTVGYKARPATYGKQGGLNFSGESIKVKLHTFTNTAKVIVEKIILVGRKLRRKY